MFLGLAYGPMGSGKSTYLYDKYRAFNKRGSNILALTHVLDTRHDESICTHSRLFIPAIKVDSLLSVKTEGYDVILIDEAQFFPDLYQFVNAKREDDVHIFVSGLNGDANQSKFGQILDLIPMASECIHRVSICDICGHHAPFTKKKAIEGSSQVDPGGFDKYYTVCHRHIGE